MAAVAGDEEVEENEEVKELGEGKVGALQQGRASPPPTEHNNSNTFLALGTTRALSTPEVRRTLDGQVDIKDAYDKLDDMTLGDMNFVGEFSFLTGERATADVFTVSGRSMVLAWDRER